MYSNYTREEMVKSVGVEYINLDDDALKLILDYNMTLFNLKQYYKSPINQNINKDKSLSISISINNNSYLNNDMLRLVVLNITDLDTIKQLYDTNKLIRDALNNKEFLRTLANNILNSIPLLKNNITARRTNNTLIEFVNIMGQAINNINTFDDFVKWYETNFYTSNCDKYGGSFVCYSGALSNNDNNNKTGISKYLPEMESHYEKGIGYITSLTIALLPIENIVNIINVLNISGDTFRLLVSSIAEHYSDLYLVNRSTISENDMNIFLSLLDKVDKNQVYRVLRGFLPYPDAFAFVYNYLLDKGYDINMGQLLKEYSNININIIVLDASLLNNVLESLNRIGYNDIDDIKMLVLSIIKRSMNSEYLDISEDVIETAKNYVSINDIKTTIHDNIKRLYGPDRELYFQNLLNSL